MLSEDGDAMIEVEDLTDNECLELLESEDYGHLACSMNDRPYVVPIHYVFSTGEFYVYTTEGKKFEMIRANPNVCLQVERVKSAHEWESVIVFGKALQIHDEDERSFALSMILERNPGLTPAVSIRWMDSWVRENIEVIYRITPSLITGRTSGENRRPRRANPPRPTEDATLS